MVREEKMHRAGRSASSQGGALSQSHLLCSSQRSVNKHEPRSPSTVTVKYGGSERAPQPEGSHRPSPSREPGLSRLCTDKLRSSAASGGFYGDCRGFEAGDETVGSAAESKRISAQPA